VTSTPEAVPDPGFEQRVSESFARLALMSTIGARLVKVAAGAVDIDMPVREDLTQQHGYVAAAIVTALVDTACGYAAMSLMPPGAGVVTVEYKVNFIAPARGERLLARGHVVRAGRRLTVCAGEVYALTSGGAHPVATMLGTMAVVHDIAEISSCDAVRSS
jgi:uncharacterized protein (TIGR00369 family)